MTLANRVHQQSLLGDKHSAHVVFSSGNDKTQMAVLQNRRVAATVAG